MLLIIIELKQDGMPPLAYLSQGFRRLLRRYPSKRFYGRVAMIHGTGFSLSIMKSFLGLLQSVMGKGVDRRFFARSERAEADAWLLSHVPTTSNL
ncbi:hypothetical protein HC776_03050 [bacterium]|nr:hypothetical protein [bacterium]